MSNVQPVSFDLDKCSTFGDDVCTKTTITEVEVCIEYSWVVPQMRGPQGRVRAQNKKGSKQTNECRSEKPAMLLLKSKKQVVRKTKIKLNKYDC